MSRSFNVILACNSKRALPAFYLQKEIRSQLQWYFPWLHALLHNIVNSFIIISAMLHFFFFLTHISLESYEQLPNSQTDLSIVQGWGTNVWWCVPGSVLGGLHLWSHLLLIIIFSRKAYRYPRRMLRLVLRRSRNFPRSRKIQWQSRDSNSHLSDSRNFYYSENIVQIWV